MANRLPVLRVTIVLAFLLAFVACNKGGGELTGEPGDAADADRVVTLDATNELRFEPDSIDVEQGETIEFQISNVADVDHEFVLGPLHAHDAGMHHAATDPSATGPISPGDVASVVWTFTDAGQVEFACYIAGHNEAGMTGTVEIAE